MLYRKFGNTTEQLSILGFGAAPIGLSGYQNPGFVQSESERESKEAIDTAVGMGINFFDTAPAYANKIKTGRWNTDRASERMLGEVLCKHTRDKLFISTKNMFDELHPEGVRASLEESLRLLKTDYVDLYQFHGVIMAPYTSSNLSKYLTTDIMAEFLKLRDEGKCRYLGISGYREEGVCAAMEMGHFQAVMPQFNFFYRNAEWELVKIAKEKSISVLPMRGLTGGIITALKETLDPENNTMESWIPLAMEYLLKFECVSSIPGGMRTAQEVRNNVKMILDVAERLTQTK